MIHRKVSTCAKVAGAHGVNVTWSRMSKKHTFSYICNDCILIFQTYGLVRQGKPLCPNCGDNIAVTPQKGIYSTKEVVKNLKTPWKDEELLIIQRCLSGEITQYAASILTGRSKDSVAKKLKRVRCSE